jgi:uncharacterized delta-60 repeat protein
MGNIEPLEPRRLLASGDLDPTFGTGGRRSDDLGSLHDITDAVELPGGKILVSGATIDILLAEQRHYMLRRYNADGTPDTTFGQGGEVLGNFFPIVGGDDENHDPRDDDDSVINDIFLQDDGKIMARGEGQANALHPVMARFNSDGSLDTTFGGDGVIDVPFNATPLWTVQPDGKLLLPEANGIKRFNLDGSIDTSFGNQGTAPIAVENADLINVQSDNKILLASATDKLVITRLNADGSVDTAFGTNGVIQGPVVPAEAAKALGQLLLLPDGKIVAVSTEGNFTDTGFHIARFNADATLDTTFGDGGDGETFIHFGANTLLDHLVLDQDGNIIVLGSNPGLQMVRVTPDGLLDETFGRIIALNPIDGFVSAHNAFMQGNALLIVGGRNAEVDDRDFRSFVTFDRIKANDSGPASPIALNGGVVSVMGTSGADTIDLFNDGTSIFTTLNGFGRAFPTTDVQQASVTGGAGDDWIRARNATTRVHIAGGPGSDKIAGGTGRDTLEGNAGRDFIDGGDGADVISGGAGNDQIRGQASSDHLYGRDGNDYLEGNGGNDAIDGGNGVDVLHGNEGADLLVSAGDSAIDSVFGDDGQDRAHADPDDILDSIESIV